MMFSLPVETWLRLYVWLVLGLLIYYLYGQRNSKLRLAEPANSTQWRLTLGRLALYIVAPVGVYFLIKEVAHQLGGGF